MMASFILSCRTNVSSYVRVTAASRNDSTKRLPGSVNHKASTAKHWIASVLDLASRELGLDAPFMKLLRQDQMAAAVEFANGMEAALALRK